MSAPIQWNGQICTLYFMNYYKRVGLNNQATTMFGRQGFHIYGPAIVAVQTSIWYCLRVLDSQQSVRNSISHLTLGKHAVVPTSRRNTHQDVIAQSLSDITMLKMVL